MRYSIQSIIPHQIRYVVFLKLLFLHVQKLKEKEAALWKEEQNVVSRDRVINELRLRLPAAADRERLLADLAKHEECLPDSQPALKLAHQTIKDLQGRLDKKEDVLKKYQSQLARARQVH